MDSNLTVELYVTKKSCQNLVNKSCNIWVKNSELDKHDFLSLVRASSAQLAGDLLGLKNHGYPVPNFSIQSLFNFLNKF